ncbi:hypothetical protein KI387_007275, partial [Taxus chinensis]
STCSSRIDGGTTVLHKEFETPVASFVGKSAALVYGMGFAKNSTILLALITKGRLHNTPSHLEDVLRKAIAEGQPQIHRPWEKIIVGIYIIVDEISFAPALK